MWKGGKTGRVMRGVEGGLEEGGEGGGGVYICLCLSCVILSLAQRINSCRLTSSNSLVRVRVRARASIM